MTIRKRDRLPSQSKPLPYRLGGKSSMVMVLLLLTTLITACTSEPETTDPNADRNVTTEEVAEQTNAVAGQDVTIRSEVKQKVGESSFTLQDEKLAPGEEILVVNVSGKPFVLPEDNDMDVQVTGEVKSFKLVEVERDYNLDLDPDLYAEFETQPAVLAKSLALAPEPGDVTKTPDRFYNLAIAVEGEVEEIIDPATFTLDEEQLFGATDLLVIGAPITEALDGQTVTVTGQLRPFILTEFEQDYDLTWDLDVKKELEAEYSEKPVFVATGIYPTAQ